MDTVDKLIQSLNDARNYAEILPDSESKDDIKFDIDALIQRIECNRF